MIDLGFERIVRIGRRRMLVAAAISRWRRGRQEMAHIVPIYRERIPLYKCVSGVDERRHGVVVEEQGMAAHHLEIHFPGWRG